MSFKDKSTSREVLLCLLISCMRLHRRRKDYTLLSCAHMIETVLFYGIFVLGVLFWTSLFAGLLRTPTSEKDRPCKRCNVSSLPVLRVINVVLLVATILTASAADYIPNHLVFLPVYLGCAAISGIGLYFLLTGHFRGRSGRIHLQGFPARFVGAVMILWGLDIAAFVTIL